MVLQLRWFETLYLKYFKWKYGSNREHMVY